MGDAHEVVVNDVGEVVGGQAVALDEHLVVQRGIFHGDVAEDGVVEGGSALLGDLLADDIGHAGVQLGLDLLRAQAGAAAVVLVDGHALGHFLLLAVLFVAEAAVGRTLLNEKLCVLAVEPLALGLDVGTCGAAHIGTFVVGQAALSHGLVDDVHGALHQAALVGVLNAQNEGALIVPGNEPGVEGSAQVAHVHIARGAGGEAGAHLSLGDPGFHLFKKIHVVVPPLKIDGTIISIFFPPVND